MSHSHNSSGHSGLGEDQNRATQAKSRTEWDADTDVMPPEYCRQLMRISRQLQREV